MLDQHYPIIRVHRNLTGNQCALALVRTSLRGGCSPSTLELLFQSSHWWESAFSLTLAHFLLISSITSPKIAFTIRAVICYQLLPLLIYLYLWTCLYFFARVVFKNVWLNLMKIRGKIPHNPRQVQEAVLWRVSIVLAGFLLLNTYLTLHSCSLALSLEICDVPLAVYLWKTSLQIKKKLHKQNKRTNLKHVTWGY